MYIVVSLTATLIFAWWSMVFLAAALELILQWSFSSNCIKIYQHFIDCYQLELCHELLVDQLDGHLLQPHAGCESKNDFCLKQKFKYIYGKTYLSPFQRPWAAGTWTSSRSCSPGPCWPRRSTLRTAWSTFLLVATTKRFPKNCCFLARSHLFCCFPQSFTSALALPQIMSKWPATPPLQSWELSPQISKSWKKHIWSRKKL